MCPPKTNRARYGGYEEKVGHRVCTNMSKAGLNTITDTRSCGALKFAAGSDEYRRSRLCEGRTGVRSHGECPIRFEEEAERVLWLGRTRSTSVGSVLEGTLGVWRLRLDWADHSYLRGSAIFGLLCIRCNEDCMRCKQSLSLGRKVG